VRTIVEDWRWIVEVTSVISWTYSTSGLQSFEVRL
jgi:hypothetical protein